MLTEYSYQLMSIWYLLVSVKISKYSDFISPFSFLSLSTFQVIVLQVTLALWRAHKKSLVCSLSCFCLVVEMGEEFLSSSLCCAESLVSSFKNPYEFLMALCLALTNRIQTIEVTSWYFETRLTEEWQLPVTNS